MAVAGSTIVDYMGSGLIADRPAAPPVPTGGSAFYYATDESKLYVWDAIASAWDEVGGGGGGGGLWYFDPPATTDFATSVTDGSASNTSYSDDTDIGLIIGAQVGGDDNLFAKLTAAPSFPFTITAHFAFHGCRDSGAADGHIGGVVLRASGTKLRTVFGPDTAGGVNALGIRASTDTSYTANVAFANYNPSFGSSPGLWVQIVVTSATNIVYKVSRDGKNFTIWQSNTANGQVSGLDQIGLGITRRSSVDQPAYLVCDHWSVT